MRVREFRRGDNIGLNVYSPEMRNLLTYALVSAAALGGLGICVAGARSQGAKTYAEMRRALASGAWLRGRLGGVDVIGVLFAWLALTLGAAFIVMTGADLFDAP